MGPAAMRVMVTIGATAALLAAAVVACWALDRWAGPAGMQALSWAALMVAIAGFAFRIWRRSGRRWTASPPPIDCPDCRLAARWIRQGLDSIHCGGCGAHWLSLDAAKALNRMSSQSRGNHAN